MSWSRRTFTELGALAPFANAAAAEKRDPGLIARENRKPGSADWQLTKVRPDKRGAVRSSLIEGYCSHQCIGAGQRLEFFVSTRPPSRFQIEIFRTGYYGGRGARAMTVLGPFQGKPQEDPPVGEARVRECRWEASAEITIPLDWPSGVYLGRLMTLPESRTVHAWQNYTVFIVKDGRPADILFQCSENTWQAYNKWPDNYSLYTDPRHPWAPGVAVSFDRPYGMYPQIYENPQSFGSGEFR